MSAIQQITAGPADCQTLVKLGINPRAFFWNVKEGDDWDTWELEEQPIFKENEIVPAWTMQELNVMIGGDFAKPDFHQTNNLKVASVPEGDKKKTVYIYQYCIYTPKTMFSWECTRLIKNPGPAASAFLLIDLLKDEELTAEKCNERYNAIFPL